MLEFPAVDGLECEALDLTEDAAMLAAVGWSHRRSAAALAASTVAVATLVVDGLRFECDGVAVDDDEALALVADGVVHILRAYVVGETGRAL